MDPVQQHTFPLFQLSSFSAQHLVLYSPEQRATFCHISSGSSPISSLKFQQKRWKKRVESVDECTTHTRTARFCHGQFQNWFLSLRWKLFNFGYFSGRSTRFSYKLRLAKPMIITTKMGNRNNSPFLEWPFSSFRSLNFPVMSTKLKNMSAD